MKKLLPILAGLAMLTTTAQAQSRTVRICDDAKEDCPKVIRFQTNGDDPRVVLLRNKGEAPSYISLDRFMSQRGYLGVGLTDLTPELRDYFGIDSDYGVLVNRVEEDSPAAGAPCSCSNSGLGGTETVDISRRDRRRTGRSATTGTCRHGRLPFVWGS